MPQLTATATAQQIAVTTSGSLLIKNNDTANPVYVGATSGVTASGATGGLRLSPGESTTWRVEWPGGFGATRSAPFVVCASGQTAVVGWDQDSTGSWPNPPAGGVSLGGVTAVSGTPAAGKALVATGPTAAQWAATGTIDVTNTPLPLGVASHGTGANGAMPSDATIQMPRLLDLADVDPATMLTNGYALAWNAVAGKWQAVPLGVAGAPLWQGIDAGEITLPRGHTDDSGSFGANPASGEMRLSYFRAQNSGSRSTVRFQTGGTAAAASTLARVGLYSVDTSGNLTLIGSCANKTTFAGTYAQQTCALTAAVTLTAGSLYAIGVLQVATTPATVAGQWFNGTFMGGTPKMARKVTGLADLPATVTTGFTDSQFPIYCEIV